MTLHFLNDVANDAESTQKSIITSYSLVLRIIYRIPGSRLLLSSLPGSASRTHVESLGKPQARLRERMLNRSASLAMSTSVLEALPGKLGTKYSLYWYKTS